MIKSIKVGELRRILSEESKNEFKPVVFGDVESKRINGKAYNDIKKETEKYNGGIGNKPQNKKNTAYLNDNKGMQDLEYDSINKPYNERVKSQMKGYTSKMAEDMHKNDEFGNASFDKKCDFYTAAKNHASELKSKKDKASEIGLTGRKISKDDIRKNSQTIGESRKIKQLKFKNTYFLSEGHMVSLIPDEYKKNGKRFIMRDGKDNQYLVEWNGNTPDITKRVNMNIVNEEKKRIQELWGYKSSESINSTPQSRLSEGKKFGEMIDKARKLIK